MKDKDVIEALTVLLRSEHAPPLTDEVVDAFLSIPLEDDPQAIKRIQAGFATAVISEFHQEPVREIEQRISFGEWIKSIRKKVRLTSDAIAVAIRKDAQFIEGIEKGSTSLFKLDPHDITELVYLFRLHINGLAQLLANTSPPASENMWGVNGEPNLASGVTGLLDPSSLPPVTYQNEHDRPNINKLLNSVRQDLRQRKATHLLD